MKWWCLFSFALCAATCLGKTRRSCVVCAAARVVRRGPRCTSCKRSRLQEEARLGRHTRTKARTAFSERRCQSRQRKDLQWGHDQLHAPSRRATSRSATRAIKSPHGSMIAKHVPLHRAAATTPLKPPHLSLVISLSFLPCQQWRPHLGASVIIFNNCATFAIVRQHVAGTFENPRHTNPEWIASSNLPGNRVNNIEQTSCFSSTRPAFTR